jgi:hypothetical protein
MMSFAALAVLFIVSNANAQCAFFFSGEKELVLQSKNGASVSQTFYVKSLSDGASTAQITIGGIDAAQFTVDPSTIEFTGLHQKKEVRITYTPGANTLRASATLEVSGMGMICYSGILIGALKDDNPSGDYKLVVDPAQYTFPVTPVGQETCREFHIFNKGTATAYIPSWSLLTDWANDFSVDPTTADVKELKAGESMMIRVCYKPTETRTNPISGYLAISYSFDQNATDYSTLKAWFGTKQGGNDTVFTKLCLKQGETTEDWRTQVSLDSTGNRTLRIVNPSANDIIITNGVLDGEDAKAFMLGVTFPISVPANSTLEVPFTFTPYATSAGTAKEKYFAFAVFTLQGNGTNFCTSFKAVVYGYSIFIHNGDKDSTKDNVGIPIFGKDKTTIGLSNRGIKESYTLLFYNNLDVDLTVKEIYMKVGEFFKVTETSPASTPFVLKPGEEMTVTISYESTDKMIHKDALVIVADKAADVIEIGLEGGDFAALSVKPALPAGVAIFVSPNPAHSDVKVDFAGTTHANIEVMDMLGNTIARGETSSDWSWNGKTTSGTTAANGAYIIRIAGTSISGEQFVTSKRVILQK